MGVRSGPVEYGGRPAVGFTSGKPVRMNRTGGGAPLVDRLQTARPPAGRAGRVVGYKQTYRPAYRKAYRRALKKAENGG